MADDERTAVIVLGNGEILYVQSTIEQISAEIEKRKSLTLPVIPVVDEHGRELWFNANHITSFYKYDPEQPMVPFGR